MKVYESKDIRNVGVVGHGDSGKTTLTAGLLFAAGATNRLLRVDEGNTITDFDDEEIQRKITISTAVATAEWKKSKINILDTPGYNIFINDTKAALVPADAAKRACRQLRVLPNIYTRAGSGQDFRQCRLRDGDILARTAHQRVTDPRSSARDATDLHGLVRSGQLSYHTGPDR